MKQTAILLFSMLILNSCNKSAKDEGKSPEPTGTNTFGCFIDGKRVSTSGAQSNGMGIYSRYGGVDFYYSNSTWYISARTDDPKTEFEFQITRNNSNEYVLNNATNFGSYSIKETNSADNDYKTDSIRTGKILITKYIKDSVLAGTFSFDAINSAGYKIHVTEGWFDIGK